jgi:hypothetical protein
MIRREERRILKAEATLLRIPIFALAVKGLASLDGIEFRQDRRRGDKMVQVLIRTERDTEVPYPGPLSRRIHMAFLSQIAERGFPFQNPLEWTWRELCRRMGLPNSGRRGSEFKRAIRATWGLKIFGMERLDGRVRESWRRLYAECEFQNDVRANGSIIETNRLWLAPWYLDSLDALHAAPVDYDVWKRLELIGPLASRLYEYLIPSFYKRESLELAYDRLASAMPVVSEVRRSHAIRQFAPALEVLQAEGIIAQAGWDAMKGTGRPKLILTRGPLLAPRESVAATVAGVRQDSTDQTLRAQVIAEFYTLMGMDVRPVRADQAVAGEMIARAGSERTLRMLPEAVRRLKLRFRNAETMGALVRYFDEMLREDERKHQDEERADLDRTRREAELDRQRQEDQQAAAAWAALGEPERVTIRTAVLNEHPNLHRFPKVLEAACVSRLASSAKPSVSKYSAG